MEILKKIGQLFGKLTGFWMRKMRCEPESSDGQWASLFCAGARVAAGTEFVSFIRNGQKTFILAGNMIYCLYQ